MVQLILPLLHYVSPILLPSELLSVAYYVTVGPVYLPGPLPLLGNAGPARTVCEPYFTRVGCPPNPESAEPEALFVMLIIPHAPGLEEKTRVLIRN